MVYRQIHWINRDFLGENNISMDFDELSVNVDIQNNFGTFFFLTILFYSDSIFQFFFEFTQYNLDATTLTKEITEYTTEIWRIVTTFNDHYTFFVY